MGTTEPVSKPRDLIRRPCAAASCWGRPAAGHWNQPARGRRRPAKADWSRVDELAEGRREPPGRAARGARRDAGGGDDARAAGRGRGRERRRRRVMRCAEHADAMQGPGDGPSERLRCKGEEPD